MPNFYVVANVAYELSAANEEAALEMVERGNAPSPKPISARVYETERAYLAAAKVSPAARRQWLHQRGRRG